MLIYQRPSANFINGHGALHFYKDGVADEDNEEDLALVRQAFNKALEEHGAQCVFFSVSASRVKIYHNDAPQANVFT